MLLSPFWTEYALLFPVGLVAGTLNVLAGGGSMLTLPLMIFLGLPATVANGTNRVAILVQNVGAVWSFHRHGLMDWSWLRLAAGPAVLGSVVGTSAAVVIGDVAFQRTLAVVMILVALWTIWDPLRSHPVGDRLRVEGSGQRRALAVAFFLVGAYGGFIQAGVGFLALAVTTLARLDLVRGNALKVMLALTFTAPALAIFAFNGKVAWGMGAALAAGNFLGGLLGVRLNVLKGHEWVKRVVTVVVVVFAVRLLMT